jgi:hypothetical protein
MAEEEEKMEKNLDPSRPSFTQRCSNTTLIHAVMVLLVLEWIVDESDTDDRIKKSTDELQDFVKSV